GSLGLNLATSIDITLVDTAVTTVPTGVCGPVVAQGQNVGALLLGRSSAAIKGLIVIPGLIDADYTGEILIMIKTDFPPMIVPRYSKIAQLVPLTQLVTSDRPTSREERGARGFGSTGTAAMLSLSMGIRPTAVAGFRYHGGTITLTALLDTGADVTIVS
ncbi:POK9 protein, partial [Cnemophilus loriae]|nr:POK9 protein [Cnemophilus loriae]